MSPEWVLYFPKWAFYFIQGGTFLAPRWVFFAKTLQNPFIVRFSMHVLTWNHNGWLMYAIWHNQDQYQVEYTLCRH